METITVLLSTYNGSRYIDRQLESIYRQTGLDQYAVRIVCRDDGSSDDTVEHINAWKEKLSISIIEGKNIGARASFFRLLDQAPESDYYAFCDQDDVWYEDKLSRAIAMIRSPKTLYFSNIEYIDAEDCDLGKRLLADKFELSLKRVLMCNPANGCTMVWENHLQAALKDIPRDTFTMHDEFMCTVALLLGHIVYDPRPAMGYRLHDLNVTQSNNLVKKVKLWKSIWFGRKPYSLDKRAAMLLQFDLKDADREILYQMSRYKFGINRFKLISGYSCEDRGIERSFKLRMLIGLL